MSRSDSSPRASSTAWASIRRVATSAAAEPGSWRRLLVPSQAAEIEAIAGEELRRVGYGA